MSDAIPIQNLIDQAKRDFIAWSSSFIVTALIKSMPWTVYIKSIITAFIQLVITWLVAKGELGIFILNTVVLTSAQAKDYRIAVAKRMNLPPDVSDADWEVVENEANHAFINLIRFTA